jgi:glycosyltransferase involved in cell wall biosynthesis
VIIPHPARFMRILHLESSRSWGGQEYRTCLEINWLNAHGHSAWLMCDEKSDVLARARAVCAQVIPATLRRRFDPMASHRIWRFCRAHEVDLIKCYSSKDHWLAFPSFLAGVPLSRARCITDPVGSGSRAFIYKHGCNKIVADAKVIKDRLIAENGIAPEKIEFVPSAVDLDKFSPKVDPSKFRAELGISAETPLIVNIGMIRSDKGQSRLIKAAGIVLQRHPETRFVFVGKGTGTGRQETRLREAAASPELKDRVFVLGYRWDTPEILRAASMAVIASLGTEASPIVLREAFATGRPVVATRVGDVPDVICDGENGLLVPPNDVEALAAAINRFLDDRALAERCGRLALDYARAHFDFDRMMEAKIAIDLETIQEAKS